MRFMLVLCALWVMSPIASANDALVDTKVALEILKSARDSFYDDIARFNREELTEDELIDRIAAEFSPLIDERLIAARVMGRYARQATEEERQAFVSKLESSLLDLYSRGLAGYGGQRLLLPENAILIKPGKMRIEAQLESDTREPLPIQFSLGYSESKGWLVENVIIAGINLGLVLRNQFADLVQSTGSISGAIDAWTFESVSAE